MDPTEASRVSRDSVLIAHARPRKFCLVPRFGDRSQVRVMCRAAGRTTSPDSTRRVTQQQSLPTRSQARQRHTRAGVLNAPVIDRARAFAVGFGGVDPNQC